MHQTWLIRRRELFGLGALGGALAAAARAAPAEATEHTPPVWIPPDIGAREPWVAVNLSWQATVAMVGREAVRVALATTGKDGWETPEGIFRINRRVYNETMTSAAIGIPEGPDSYVLTDVLYTQYFTYEGHALHLNYWRPNWVFGAARTSAGCVGMRHDDAAFFWRHAGIGSRVVIHS